MPILQEKVISLVETGLRAHQRLETTREIITRGRDNLNTQILNELQKESPSPHGIANLAKQFIDALYYRLEEMQLENLNDRLLLIREQERYNYRAKHNEYARNRLRRQKEEKLEDQIVSEAYRPKVIIPGTPAAQREIQRRAEANGVRFDAEGNIIPDSLEAKPYQLPKNRKEPKEEESKPRLGDDLDPEAQRAKEITQRDQRALETGEDLPP